MWRRVLIFAKYLSPVDFTVVRSPVYNEAGRQAERDSLLIISRCDEGLSLTNHAGLGMVSSPIGQVQIYTSFNVVGWTP